MLYQHIPVICFSVCYSCSKMKSVTNASHHYCFPPEVSLIPFHNVSQTRGLGTSRGVKRKNIVDHLSEKNRHHNEQLGQGHSERAFGSGPMVGFGLPNETMHICNRTLSDIAEGPPYFYLKMWHVPQKVSGTRCLDFSMT